MDPRGRVLGYAGTVEIRSRQHGEGTLGLADVTFAPDLAGRIGSSYRVDLLIASLGIPRLRIQGVRFPLLSGEELVTTGEYACTAAIGEFRSCQLISHARRGKTRPVSK
jgi:hypothetical protein